MGEPGPKRTEEQRELDLAKIAEFYVQGWSQRRIAEKFSLTQQQICYDLKEIRGRWVQTQIASVDERKAKELEKIDRVESESWEAWEKSKRIQETKRAEKIKQADGSEINKASTTVEDSAGDPRFLDKVAWCVEQRCKIFGLHAPTKIAPTNPEGDKPYQLDVRQLSAEEQDILWSMRQRLLERTRITIAAESEPFVPNPTSLLSSENKSDESGLEHQANFDDQPGA